MAAHWIPLWLLFALFSPGFSARNDDEQEMQSEGTPKVAVSVDCATCHANSSGAAAMRDETDEPLGPFDLWQASMMANATRDPFWRASVAVEMAATPARASEIGAQCLSCHAPMASRTGLDDHGTGTPLHVLDCEGDLGELARDGVSCTICHGMTSEGFGSEQSFSGGYRLDDRQRLFGPHAQPFTMPMRHHTGFTPTEGTHILRSALCGTCHTLRTGALDASGKDLGVTHLEQSPYLEWRNSAFRTADEPGGAGSRPTSCQACHVPTTSEYGLELETRIARNPGGRDWPRIQERKPYGRHVFRGANALMLGILRDNAQALGVPASQAALTDAVDGTRSFLRSSSARLWIENVEYEGGQLAFDVGVENLGGHKLPTGHPSRRAWLRVLVRDAEGKLVFASGDTDESGRIVDGAGQPLHSELVGGPVRPHLDRVERPDQVVSFEAVQADIEGNPTHLLLRAAGWWKDDRLLPSGWREDHPEAHETAPVGVGQDDTFVAGGDLAHFRIPQPLEPGFRVEVDLLYQTIGARWAAELARWDLPEVRTFGKMLAEQDVRTEILGQTSWPTKR